MHATTTTWLDIIFVRNCRCVGLCRFMQRNENELIHRVAVHHAIRVERGSWNENMSVREYREVSCKIASFYGVTSKSEKRFDNHFYL